MSPWLSWFQAGSKVHNFVLVSNRTALDVMAERAKELGYTPTILSTENYKSADDTVSQFESTNDPKTVLLAGGEIRLKIDRAGGSGGRNSYLVSKSIGRLNNSVLISLASDGTDNGDSAGAIADDATASIAAGLNVDVVDYIERYDTYDLFEKLNGTIYTGPTGSNVSDLIIYLMK